MKIKPNAKLYLTQILTERHQFLFRRTGTSIILESQEYSYYISTLMYWRKNMFSRWSAEALPPANVIAEIFFVQITEFKEYFF